MPAPIVIPVVENMATATCYAEKANRVSENKYKIAVGILSTQESDRLAKMDKELFKLKHELAVSKPRRRTKRYGKRELDRGSPDAKLIRVASCESPVSDIISVSESVDAKRRHRGPTMAERMGEERVNNLHRRYSALQALTRPNIFLDFKSACHRLKPRTP